MYLLNNFFLNINVNNKKNVNLGGQRGPEAQGCDCNVKLVGSIPTGGNEIFI